ncbi:MAG: T9SS type A sorting domain-containing protein [Chitinophagaceae bacterium]
MLHRVFSAIALFLLSAVSSTQAQSVLTTESFDNVTFAPSGWSIKPPMTPTNAWVRSTTSTNPTANPHSGAGFARFRSRTIPAGTQQLLVSRPVDYSNRGNSAANLSFWMFRDNSANTWDSLTVYVDNSDTLTGTAVRLGVIARNRSYALPDTQATNAWYQYTFAIPTAFTNSTTTHFIFLGTSQAAGANNGAYIYLDDVSYDEFPSPCTGIPNVGNIVNSNPIMCGGSGNATLNLSVPLAVSGLTYSWEKANSNAGPWVSFATSANTTTGNLVNTTWFRCVVTCSNSNQTYTTPVDSCVVSANPNPSITVPASPQGFCAGSNGANLTVSGASTYTWLPVTGLSVSTGATVIAAPAANTQYTVTGIDANGCSATATINVVPSNPPTLTMTSNPTAPVCSGTTVVLNCVGGPNPPAGTTFLWSNGVTTRRDTIVLLFDTTLSVTVTNQFGCSSTDSIQLQALPAQNSNFGWTQNGATFNFNDSTNGATQWLWDFGDGNGSFSSNPTYTYSGFGVFTVTLIVVGPCKTDTITKIIELYPAGVNDVVNQSTVHVSPNPATDVLNIQLSNGNIGACRLIDFTGKVIRTIQPANRSSVMQINVVELPAGVYTLLVQTDHGTEAVRWVK